MQPTEQQIEEFWKWCGFYQSEAQIKTHWWHFPDGSIQHLPPIDLNNLFQWAVPKVRETYNNVRVIFTYGSVTNCSLYQFGKLYSRKKNFQWLRIGERSDEDPALALFWAIYKVAHDVNKLDKEE